MKPANDSSQEIYPCVVRILDGKWYVECLDDENLVRVNGRAIRKEPLEEGCLIELTETRIHVTFQGSYSAAAYETTRISEDHSIRSDEDELYQMAKTELAIAGYVLYQELGRGSFARVFLAQDNRTGQYVAIKVLDVLPSASDKVQEVFRRETESLKQLNHPNIVSVHCVGSFSNGILWCAMDCIPGMNLKCLVQKRGPLTLTDACATVTQLLQALQAAHELAPPTGPLVHRDVKPSNIMMSGNSPDYKAVLADFGLAKNFADAGNSGITKTGDVRGTLNFMSPEQLIDSKYVGPEGDVFGAGAVLYYCLSGQLMYRVTSDVGGGDLVQKILHREIVPLEDRCSGVPAELISMFRCAVGLDHVRRFRTCHRFLQALRVFTPPS